LLEVTSLSKQYPTPRGALEVLSGVSFALERGQAAAITGPSGSGKSTLLHILGALEPPSSGTVRLDGVSPFDLDQKALAAFRNQRIGFVFQDHCLLPQCTVLENVLVPTLVARTNNRNSSDQPPDKVNYIDRARSLLDHVGLTDRIDHLPAELSGGEKQRVALARALINQPLLLLCDEPTGNLDRKSAESVASLLLGLHAEAQTILIVVTHSAELASKFQIQFGMIDSQLRKV
jgi:lipoprotein-releasing system ATP-binding protein